MSTWLIWSIVVAGAMLLLGFVVTLGARTRFLRAREKYSHIEVQSGATGKDIAFAALEVYSLDEVSIASTPNKESNAYSIKDNTLILSEDVLESSSIYALAVVSHEVGHAREHKKGSFALALWYALVHFERFTCFLILPLFAVGLVLSLIHATTLLGTVMLNVSTLFTFIAIFNRILNLPNEMRATDNGIEMLTQSEAMTKSEIKGAKKVLAAALGTYFLGFYERLFLNFYLIKRAGKFAITKIKGRKGEGR